jgi:hypothetical protein
MKCKYVPSALATGGLIARWRARRHVARCPACAEVQIQIQDITRALAEIPPLTSAQRVLWTAAGTEPIPARDLPGWVVPAGLMAATVLIVALGFKLWGPQFGGGQAGPIAQGSQPPKPPPQAQPSPPGKLMNDMLAKVDRLDRELAEVRREADLLDVRKDADALWARYAPRNPSAL